MSIAACIFTILGALITPIWLFINFFDNNIIVLISIIVLVIDWVIAVKTIISTTRGEKSVGLGICNVIFCGILGGLLYLIWDPENQEGNDIENTISLNETSNHNNSETTKTKTYIYTNKNIKDIESLADLKEKGIITSGEFEQKKKELLDKI